MNESLNIIDIIIREPFLPILSCLTISPLLSVEFYVYINPELESELLRELLKGLCNELAVGLTFGSIIVTFLRLMRYLGKEFNKSSQHPYLFPEKLAIRRQSVSSEIYLAEEIIFLSIYIIAAITEYFNHWKGSLTQLDTLLLLIILSAWVIYDFGFLMLGAYWGYFFHGIVNLFGIPMLSIVLLAKQRIFFPIIVYIFLLLGIMIGGYFLLKKGKETGISPKTIYSDIET